MDVIKTLNFIRQDASSSYTDRIPQATRDNIAEIGNALNDYPALKNEFLDALVNKVALTLVTSDEYTNPFEQFKGEAINYGDTVEDIFIELPKGEEFTELTEGESVDPYKVNKPSVKVLYHSLDRKNTYTVTIQDDMLRQAFSSSAGFTSLVSQIVQTLYEALTEDEFIYGKHLLSNESEVYGLVEDIGEVDDSETLASNVLAQLKMLSSRMRFRSTDYNVLEVETKTPRDMQVVFIREDVMRAIDTQILAGVFNLNKAEIENRIIEVDGFDDADQLCAIVDERGFRIHDALKTGESMRNSKALYTNYFVHHWGVVSWSKYRNAVMIKGTVAPEA